MTSLAFAVADLDDLRARVDAGHRDFAILLGGSAYSRKTIRRKGDLWIITNHIDRTRQTLTSDELWTESNIGLALDRGALRDMTPPPAIGVDA